MLYLNAKILSFNKVVVQKENLDIVVVPSVSGDMGINFGERVLTHVLKAGVVYFLSSSRVIGRYFVMGGRFFAEGSNVVINTEEEVYDLETTNSDYIVKQITYYDNLLLEEKDQYKKDFYANQVVNYQLLLSSIKHMAY